MDKILATGGHNGNQVVDEVLFVCAFFVSKLIS